jgi:signal transduction histidine kinase
MDVADRQRALVEAGIALTSKLSLDGVLDQLVRTAAALTDARYAALGVVEPGGTTLERFLTHGLDEEEIAAIGPYPTGKGILGVLIREPHPLRLHDLTRDPRSVGIPANHPEMRTFLGVPVLLRGVSYGRLYLTEKLGGGDFTEEDEEAATLVAAQAAVAIENARLYEQATRWSRQLESLNEITAALVGEVDLDRQLTLVAARLRELVGARVVAVALARPDGTLRIEAADGADVVGTILTDQSKSAHVLRRGRSERVDDVAADPEVDQTVASALAARAQLVAPLIVGERALGVVIAVDRDGADPRFDDDDLRLMETFARRAAVAVDLSQRVERDALRRQVAAQEAERLRLARELHDETGQALTSMLLGLAIVERDSPDEMRAALGDLRELVVETLQDVRRLAVELRPKALDDFGLVPALQRLGRSIREGGELDVQVEARLRDERLPADVETAIYRIVQEALTNVIKHASARHVSVVLTRKNGEVSVVIEDDGRGFDSSTPAGGNGLMGMRERVELLDGHLAVDSVPGSGTTLILDLPVA